MLSSSAVRCALPVGFGVLLSFSTASAQSFDLGLRAGYAAASGDASAVVEMSDVADSQLFARGDLGIRVSQRIYLGPYLGYGRPSPAGAFDRACRSSSWDCSVSNTHAGFAGRFHAFPGHDWDLWVGAGYGYEWEDVSIRETGQETHVGLGASEWLVELGGDRVLGSFVSIGPFVGISSASFDDTVDELCFADDCMTIDNWEEQPSHLWLYLGLRGAVLL